MIVKGLKVATVYSNPLHVHLPQDTESCYYHTIVSFCAHEKQMDIYTLLYLYNF